MLTQLLLVQAMAPRLTVDVNEHMQASDLAGHHGHDADVPKDLHTGDASLGHAHAKVNLAENCSVCGFLVEILWFHEETIHGNFVN